MHKITYKLLVLKDLNAAAIAAFLPLVIPQAKKLFAEKSKNQQGIPIAVAAYHNDAPVGLCFGIGFPPIEQATIFSLFVHENMRGQGIGTALLKHLMQECQEQKLPLLHFSFSSSDSSVEIVNKVLAKLHWQTPQIMLDRYYFYAPTFEPDWYKSEVPILPKDLQILPWEFLKKKQLDAIKKIIKSNPILEELSPFQGSLPIQRLNSLILKRKTQILGWIITHLVDAHTIRYSFLYVDRDLRGQGPAICLLKEAIKRQKESSIKDAYTEINYKRTPAYWRQFVKKRLAPNSNKRESAYYSYYYNSES